MLRSSSFRLKYMTAFQHLDLILKKFHSVFPWPCLDFFHMVFYPLFIICVMCYSTSIIFNLANDLYFVYLWCTLCNKHVQICNSFLCFVYKSNWTFIFKFIVSFYYITRSQPYQVTVKRTMNILYLIQSNKSQTLLFCCISTDAVKYYQLTLVKLGLIWFPEIAFSYIY